MGHTPTIVTSCLAIALTIVYFIVADAGKFTFLILAAAAWFLVIICWLAQKSANYMHRLENHGHVMDDEKKKLATNYGQRQHTVHLSSSDLEHAKAELSADLETLQSSLKNKDTEIENLKAEITSLQTLVEIEKLRAELANLKALAAKESAKKK
jgi:chromosome condensin MukBEF ATPase and DNA-binding subunit MukB